MLAQLDTTNSIPALKQENVKIQYPSVSSFNIDSILGNGSPVGSPPGDTLQNSQKEKFSHKKEVSNLNNPLTNPNLPKASDKDSLLKRNSPLKKIKNVFPHGTISIGQDYGFLPYTVNMPSPASAFKSEGRIGLNALNIPLEITWFYSSQKNLIGLNNYFRISYDADSYKDRLNKNLLNGLNGYKARLGALSEQRQHLMQKMAYTDYLSDISPDKWPIPEAPKIDSLKAAGTNYNVNTTLTDSLKNITIPSYAYTTGADSLKDKYETYKHKSDSVRQLYDMYKSEYDQAGDSIKKLQQKINAIQDLASGNYSSYIQKTPYLSKVQNFLTGIKKLDIGLCYPAYSTFLVNNIPVRGINFEYAKENKFFAFTYGTTVSTLLYNNQSIDGFLQGIRNSYNYFDFNNLAAGRKILVAKFGIGAKETNHIYFGILVGRGQTSYLTLNDGDPAPKTRESNLVIEADAKYRFSEKLIFDLIVGKSSLSDQDMSYENMKASMREIFSNYRSYAALTRITAKCSATKTNLTLTVRWVDPFFKSYGIGFIRSDNMRYEVKMDQPLGKKLKYTGMLRYEQDNLLKLLNYQNTFYSFNNTLSYKVRRGLMLRASYTPLFRTLHSDNFTSSNKNSITTGLITYSPKKKKVSVQFNILCSYYIVNSDTHQINFQNFSYSHQVVFKSRIKTGLNLSWFKNNLHDSLNNNVFLGVLDIGYQFKNGSSITVAGKSAYKLNDKLYPGFIIRGSVKVYQTLYWENQIEKFIVGDLFNGYNLDNLKQFPYYCSTRLILNF